MQLCNSLSALYFPKKLDENAKAWIKQLIRFFTKKDSGTNTSNENFFVESGKNITCISVLRPGHLKKFIRMSGGPKEVPDSLKVPYFMCWGVPRGSLLKVILGGPKLNTPDNPLDPRISSIGKRGTSRTPDTGYIRQ